MDIWETYNSIADNDLKNDLGECIVESYKSMTYTFLNAGKIIQQFQENTIYGDNKKSLNKNASRTKASALQVKTGGQSPALKSKDKSPSPQIKPKGEQSKATVSKATVSKVPAEKQKTAPSKSKPDNNMQASISKASVTKGKSESKNPSKKEIVQERGAITIDPIHENNEYYGEEDYFYYGRNDIKPFRNLVENLKDYTKQVDALSQELFRALSVDMKQHAFLKDSATEQYNKYFLGMIDDLMVQRDQIMKPKLSQAQQHRDLTNFKRHYDAFSKVLDDIMNEDDKVNHENIAEQNETLKGTNSFTLMHMNGKIKFKGNCIDGDVPHGIGSMYHYNGNLMYSGNFKNGEMSDKDCKCYHFNGHLEYEGAIQDGKKQGKFLTLILQVEVHFTTRMVSFNLQVISTMI